MSQLDAAPWSGIGARISLQSYLPEGMEPVSPPANIKQYERVSRELGATITNWCSFNLYPPIMEVCNNHFTDRKSLDSLLLNFNFVERERWQKAFDSAYKAAAECPSAELEDKAAIFFKKLNELVLNHHGLMICSMMPCGADKSLDSPIPSICCILKHKQLLVSCQPVQLFEIFTVATAPQPMAPINHYDIANHCGIVDTHAIRYEVKFRHKLMDVNFSAPEFESRLCSDTAIKHYRSIIALAYRRYSLIEEIVADEVERAYVRLIRRAIDTENAFSMLSGPETAEENRYTAYLKNNAAPSGILEDAYKYHDLDEYEIKELCTYAKDYADELSMCACSKNPHLAILDWVLNHIDSGGIRLNISRDLIKGMGEALGYEDKSPLKIAKKLLKAHPEKIREAAKELYRQEFKSDIDEPLQYLK